MPPLVIDVFRAQQPHPPGPCRNGAESGPGLSADLQALEAALLAGAEKRPPGRRAQAAQLGFRGLNLGIFPPAVRRKFVVANDLS